MSTTSDLGGFHLHLDGENDSVMYGIVGGLIVGGIAGAWFGYRAAKFKYEKVAEDEIRDMREYYKNQAKATEARLKAPLDEVVEYLGYVKADKVEELPQIEEHIVEAEVVEETTNVFDTQVDDDWDYEVEKALRAEHPGEPYVIHLDEYGEEGYSTACYTFYEDDEILADERDEIIDDVPRIVGNCLNFFGHGSDNKDIVMVRNDALEMDMEICKAKGSYAADTAGFLQHNYPVQKMPKRHEGFDDDS